MTPHKLFRLPKFAVSDDFDPQGFSAPWTDFDWTGRLVKYDPRLPVLGNRNSSYWGNANKLLRGYPRVFTISVPPFVGSLDPDQLDLLAKNDIDTGGWSGEGQGSIMSVGLPCMGSELTKIHYLHFTGPGMPTVPAARDGYYGRFNAAALVGGDLLRIDVINVAGFSAGLTKLDGSPLFTEPADDQFRLVNGYTMATYGGANPGVVISASTEIRDLDIANILACKARCNSFHRIWYVIDTSVPDPLVPGAVEAITAIFLADLNYVASAVGDQVIQVTGLPSVSDLFPTIVDFFGL